MLGNKETVFMIIHLLEKEVGFKIDEEYEMAAGIELVMAFFYTYFMKKMVIHWFWLQLILTKMTRI